MGITGNIPTSTVVEERWMMSDDGPTYILLSRTILNSEVFASEKVLKVWIWCLCRANWYPQWVSLKIGKGTQSIKVDRGQFLFGRHTASQALCIDGSTVYRIIKKLEEMGNITINSNNQYSIVSVVNYDDYQDKEWYKKQPMNSQQTTNELDMNQTRTRHELDMNTDNTLKHTKHTKQEEGAPKKFDPLKVELPDNLKREDWELWVKYRQQARKGFTQLTVTEQLEFLAAQPDPLACIKNSIRSGWAGLFPVKGNDTTKTTIPAEIPVQQFTDDERKRLDDKHLQPEKE